MRSHKAVEKDYSLSNKSWTYMASTSNACSSASGRSKLKSPTVTFHFLVAERLSGVTNIFNEVQYNASVVMYDYMVITKKRQQRGRMDRGPDDPRSRNQPAGWPFEKNKSSPVVELCIGV